MYCVACSALQYGIDTFLKVPPVEKLVKGSALSNKYDMDPDALGWSAKWIKKSWQPSKNSDNFEELLHATYSSEPAHVFFEVLWKMKCDQQARFRATGGKRES